MYIYERSKLYMTPQGLQPNIRFQYWERPPLRRAPAAGNHAYFSRNHAYFLETMHILQEIMHVFPEIMHIFQKSCISSRNHAYIPRSHVYFSGNLAPDFMLISFYIIVYKCPSFL